MKTPSFQLWYETLRETRADYTTLSTEELVAIILKIETDCELEFFTKKLSIACPDKLATHKYLLLAKFAEIRKIPPFFHTYLYQEMLHSGFTTLAHLASIAYPDMITCKETLDIQSTLFSLHHPSILIEYLAEPTSKKAFFSLKTLELHTFYLYLIRNDTLTVIKFIKETYFNDSMIELLIHLSSQLTRSQFYYLQIVFNLFNKYHFALNYEETHYVLSQLAPYINDPASPSWAIIERLIKKALQQSLTLTQIIRLKELLKYFYYLIVYGDSSYFEDFLKNCESRQIIQLTLWLVDYMRTPPQPISVKTLCSLVKGLIQAALQMNSACLLYEIMQFIKDKSLFKIDQTFYVNILLFAVQGSDFVTLNRALTNIPPSIFNKVFTPEFIEQLFNTIIKTNQPKVLHYFFMHGYIHLSELEAYVERIILLAALQNDQETFNDLIAYLPGEKKEAMVKLTASFLRPTEEVETLYSTLQTNLAAYSPYASQSFYNQSVTKIVKVASYLIKKYGSLEPDKTFEAVLVLLANSRHTIALASGTERAQLFGAKRYESFTTPLLAAQYSAFIDWHQSPDFSPYFKDYLITDEIKGQVFLRIKEPESTLILTSLNPEKWVHTEPCYIEEGLQLTRQDFQAIMNSATTESFIIHLASFVWLFAQIAPFMRGSAAILEYFIKAISLAKGYHFPVLNNSCLIDCVALSTPSKQIFTIMFQKIIGPQLEVLPATEPCPVESLALDLRSALLSAVVLPDIELTIASISKSPTLWSATSTSPDDPEITFHPYRP